MAAVIPGNFIDETYKDLTFKVLGGYHDDVKGMKHGLTGIFDGDADGCRIATSATGAPLGVSRSICWRCRRADGACGGIYGSMASMPRWSPDIKPKEFILPMHIGTSRL
jgi:hypothetical protein